MNGNPWDRQRDPETGKPESARWFGRFDLDFRPLGPERTILAAYKNWLERVGKVRKSIPDHAPPGWYQAAKQWRWFERAELWDAHISTEANQKLDEELIRRRSAVKSWAWTAFEALRDRIDQMLRFPLATVTRPDGEGKTTIVNPVRWSQRDVVSFAKAAIELARLAADLDQRFVVQSLNVDMATLTLDQLERMAAGENPASVLKDHHPEGWRMSASGEG